MMDTNYRIARLNAKTAIYQSNIALMQEIIRNPIVEVIGGFVAVEMLQRYPDERPIIGNLQGSLIEAGIAGIITAQQLPPMPQPDKP